MSESLVPTGYIKDEQTGFLVAIHPRGGTAFGVESKTRFLGLMEESGNFTQTCRDLGVSDRTVYDHLKLDEAFAREYAMTVRRMAHKLESTMYKNAQRPQGYMDRVTWLRRWFPNEWTPKTSVSVSVSDSGTVDKLFADIDPTKIIDATEQP